MLFGKILGALIQNQEYPHVCWIRSGAFLERLLRKSPHYDHRLIQLLAEKVDFLILQLMKQIT
jgi:hypothetical protein